MKEIQCILSSYFLFLEVFRKNLIQTGPSSFNDINKGHNI